MSLVRLSSNFVQLLITVTSRALCCGSKVKVKGNHLWTFLCTQYFAGYVHYPIVMELCTNILSWWCNEPFWISTSEVKSERSKVSLCTHTFCRLCTFSDDHELCEIIGRDGITWFSSVEFQGQRSKVKYFTLYAQTLPVISLVRRPWNSVLYNHWSGRWHDWALFNF